DERACRIARQSRYGTTGSRLDVQVALVDVRNVRAVRGELGKHERAWLSAGTHAMQRTGTRIEHPVVTACVLAPDLLGVREYEQMTSVLRPRVVVDFERVCRRRWTEQSCRDQHLSRAGPRRILHDVGAACDILRWLECGVVNPVITPACGRGPIADVGS